jgi:site-specific DNA recombinase
VTESNTAIRGALFARVSTVEQAEDGTSLYTQRTRCEAYMSAFGLTLVEEFVEEGVSGGLEEARRPKLTALLVACREHQVDAVVMTDIDRLGRDLDVVRRVERELRALGIKLVVLNSPGMTPLERDIRGAFAEEERRKITERTVAGHRRMVEAGLWPAGAPPYGYRLVADGKHKQVVLYEPEAEVIRLAVTWIVDEGCSMREVCRRLNDMNARPQRAPLWRVGHLRRRLLAPHLSGTWTYGRRSKMGYEPISRSIPPILTPERHAALIDALERRSTGPRPRENKRTYPLSKRLIGACGHPLTGVFRNDRGGRIQYRCEFAQRRHERLCPDRRVDAEPIEAIVWQEILALLSRRERLEAMASDFVAQRSAHVEIEKEQAAALDQKIAKLTKARARLMAAWAKGEFEKEVLRGGLQEIDTELTVLAQRRAQVAGWEESANKKAERLRRIADLAEYAQSRLPRMSLDERAEVIALLNIHVTVVAHPPRRQPTRYRVEGEVMAELLLEREKATDNVGGLAVPFLLEVAVA